MNILLSSYSFSPNIGGIEAVSSLLAHEFVQAEHNVKVITHTTSDNPERQAFEVFRAPSPGRLIGLVRWCDVFFHNNISLQSAWPLLLVHRPWVIAHQTWISRLDRSLAWQDHLKRVLIKFATNVAISRAIANDLPVSSVVIGNPYHDEVFRQANFGVRETELVYLGRLVSDKGVDLLIRALDLLKRDEITPRLTVVGSGPEEQALKSLTAELCLSGQIRFIGLQTGAALAELLNRHKIMVVPSRWAEPFGIVVLEGIACGCVVVGSEAGGLPDAIGPCGLTFPNGDVPALASVLRELLTNNHLISKLRAFAPDHLAKHSARNVAATYLDLFESVMR